MSQNDNRIKVVKASSHCLLYYYLTQAPSIVSFDIHIKRTMFVLYNMREFEDI